MNSVIVKTTETILSHLKTLFPNIRCEISYIPIAETELLETEQKPVIYVLPFDCECKVITNGGSREYNIEIHVVINKKLQDMDNPANEINELIEMEEKIHNEFLKKIRIGMDNFRVVADQPEYVFVSDIESIQERNCFLGAISIIAKVHEIAGNH